MKFLKNRVLPFVCAFSILISLCIPFASADWDPNRDVSDPDAVTDLESKLMVPADFSLLGEIFGIEGSVTVSSLFWNFVDAVVYSGPVGEVGIDELSAIASKYSSYFNRPVQDTFYKQLVSGSQDIASNVLAFVLFGKMSLTFETRSCGTSGMTRIYCPELDAWVVSSTGRYAYVNEAYADTSGGNQWIGETTAADRATKEVAIHSLDRLNMMCNDLRENGIPAQIRTLGSNYKCIWHNRMVYADENGIPFVSWVDENQSATSQDRPTTNVTENGDVIEGDFTDNSTNIDMEGMTITLPDGSINFIDKIIYDESTKSYHIDSHDTYNYEINNYYTWNYYINYTSITYIGQTEEYNKYYEVYYELPDGRDSADLTKEDLEQLNLSVDVIPYGRSADDTSLRSLYHFDGDTKEASYWNYCTGFTWNKGASLTYMDAGVFDGALYLDETEHQFTLTLPSHIGSQDFTLQFRYYQSATPAPQTDSSITMSGTVMAQFDGAFLKDTSGNALASVPIGSWNEIAVIRSNGTVYLYLNGLSVGSFACSTIINNQIQFTFGSAQQTFKYFDELRVLNYALVSGGSSYEPSAVPHDTNLALVLPDSAVPVADEYWSITSSKPNLLHGDFSQGSLPTSFTYNQTSHDPYELVGEAYAMCARGEQTSLYVADNYVTVTRNTSDTYSSTSYSSWYGGVFAGFSEHQSSKLVQGLPAGTYTLSAVMRDGSIYSNTFTYEYKTSAVHTKQEFDWGTLGFYSKQTNSYKHFRCTVYALPKEVGSSFDLVYMELVEGDSTDLKAEWVTSVTGIDTADLNTPTLAVRTDIDITSYQIGGVRPSIPEKGQVWAMVENDRIVSIQIYNGQAWEGVDGRIWTGQRWIPASSYNIITLQDMYDIVDATPNYEYIYSEAGFWSWWQKSWNAFTEKLFQTLGSGGAGSSGASGGSGSNELHKVDLDAEDPVSDPDQEDGKTLWQFIVLVVSGGKSVVSGTRELFSGVVSGIPDTVDDITGAFDPGGIAVGVMDGTSLDPDNSSATVSEGEVLDPWRYR